jgi:hypothetical protein
LNDPGIQDQHPLDKISGDNGDAPGHGLPDKALDKEQASEESPKTSQRELVPIQLPGKPSQEMDLKC